VQPGIMVSGPAVNDVAHMVAELAENATSLSRADTVVKISGHLLTSGGVLVDVTDEGVGMREREMQQANWLLENPPVVDVAISQRMGLFVVGRLARRHGIRARLRPAASGGVTALVWLPEGLIAHEGMGAQPGPGGPDAAGAPGRPAAEQAVTSPAMPRFAPLREDDHDAPPGLRWIPGAGLPAAEAGPARHSAPVPPSAGPAGEQQLPVSEAAGADWFRRGQVPGPAGPAAGASAGWTSPADEGWQAAEVVAVPSSSGLTTSGLPKRVPQANLIPGTAARGQPGGQPVSPPRSANATRDRFASFQRGVTQGRAALGSAPGPEGEEDTS
jgi:hypothetical protein